MKRNRKKNVWRKARPNVHRYENKRQLHTLRWFHQIAVEFFSVFFFSLSLWTCKVPHPSSAAAIDVDSVVWLLDGSESTATWWWKNWMVHPIQIQSVASVSFTHEQKVQRRWVQMVIFQFSILCLLGAVDEVTTEI